MGYAIKIITADITIFNKNDKNRFNSGNSIISEQKAPKAEAAIIRIRLTLIDRNFVTDKSKK
jgi:hypothetical protein